MADKEKLRDMIDAIISKKDEEAEIAFHDYAKGAMQDVMHPTTDTDDDDDDD